MVIGPEYVFLAMPRTASRAIDHWLRDHYSGVNPGGDHHSVEIPPEHQGKLIFAVVRNPYSRMASLYRLMKQEFWSTGYLANTDEGRGWAQQGMRADMTPAEFVDWCAEHSDKANWAPLTTTLQRATVPYRQIQLMGYERLEADLRALPFVHKWHPLPIVGATVRRTDYDLGEEFRAAVRRHSWQDFGLLEYQAYG